MKTITIEQFNSALDLLDLVPISVSTVVNTQPVHAWDEALDTQQDDIAGYGVYITNKAMQSIIGSVTNEFNKIHSNNAWLKVNPDADDVTVTRRKNWVKESKTTVKQLCGAFEMIKNKQTSLLEMDGVHIKDEDEEGFDPQAWRPVEFVPFEYNESKTRTAAKARNLSEDAINTRVKLDKAVIKYTKEQMNKTLPVEPTGKQMLTYVQKMLATATMYYDRNIAKKDGFYEEGNDQFSEEAETRAEKLAFVCGKLAAIINSAAISDKFDLGIEANLKASNG